MISHFDSVWSVVFLPNNLLASASEDCCVKLWDLNALDWIDEHRWESSEFETDDTILADNYDIFTYRGHKAPLFSLTATP